MLVESRYLHDMTITERFYNNTLNYFFNLNIEFLRVINML